MSITNCRATDIWNRLPDNTIYRFYFTIKAARDKHTTINIQVVQDEVDGTTQLANLTTYTT